MARSAKATPTFTSATPLPRPRKTDAVIDLLRRAEGATLGEITGATGWQAHSARAVLTGLRKKGHVLEKSKRNDVTCHLMTQPA